MPEVKFTFEKVTKNTIRYTEQPTDGSPPTIGSLYIQKWALGSNPPGEITVNIDWEKE